MNSDSTRLGRGLFREIAVVAALTGVGGLIRLWSLNRVGLVHFDEGIYAFAGLWSLSPRGLGDLDPQLIAYAPPGFAILVGLSYLFLGVGDVSAVLVSIVAGTLTIPAVAWVARRTFGPGAGGTAAAFAAISGPHIAFSRMALVDASFLFCFVLAVGLGQRFLERPNPIRAVALGVMVGVAQLFKYSGWVSGVSVALCAGAWFALHWSERSSRTAIATWGWGALAAVVAAAAYWPWFQFVESHGGYRALIAHQRGYMGGPSDWPGHLIIQLAESRALWGTAVWLLAATAFLGSLVVSIAHADFDRRVRVVARLLVAAAVVSALSIVIGPWLLVAVLLIGTSICEPGRMTKPALLLATGWVALSVLTPFYYPYPRLWLPLEAAGWIFMAAASVRLRGFAECGDRLIWWLPLAPLLLLAYPFIAAGNRFPGPVAPTDSVRAACRAVPRDLPAHWKALRVYARRPIAFYLALAGGIPVITQPDLDHLLEPTDSATGALLDMAMLRQDHISESQLSQRLAGWELVREFPTTLNTATLLDIEPGVAQDGAVNMQAPLRLFRPSRAGELR